MEIEASAGPGSGVQAVVDENAWELLRAGMRDHDPDAIGIPAGQEGDVPAGVSVRPAATGQNCALQIVQVRGALDRPDQVLQADPTRGMWSPASTRDQVDLEATWCEQERGAVALDGHFTCEEIPVETYRAAEIRDENYG